MNEETQKELTNKFLLHLETISDCAKIAAGCVEKDGDDFEPEFALAELRTIHGAIANALILCTRLIAEKEADND